MDDSQEHERYDRRRLSLLGGETDDGCSGDAAAVRYQYRDGRRFQCGEGWHSNENAVRFGNSSPRIPKETHFRCYASATAYVMMIPACNRCSVRLKKPRRWHSSCWPCGR